MTISYKKVKLNGWYDENMLESVDGVKLFYMSMLCIFFFSLLTIKSKEKQIDGMT
jgi:hypothetical protein